MNYRSQLVGAWMGIAAMLIMFIGLWPLMHFLPPLKPGLGQAELAAIYRGNATGIITGGICQMTASSIFMLYFSALALQLSELGVHHGDYKLDNVMYRVHDDRFIVIDFGFTGLYKPLPKGSIAQEQNAVEDLARQIGNLRLNKSEIDLLAERLQKMRIGGKSTGESKDDNDEVVDITKGRWGFTHSLGCSQKRPVPEDLVRWTNVWQLTADLGTYPIVLIGMEDPQTRSIKEIRLLVGLGPRYAHILTKDAIKAIQKECSDPEGDLWQTRKQNSKVREIILQHVRPFWV